MGGIQVGRLQPLEDAAAVLHIREAVGRSVELRADANQKWCLSEALQFGHAVKAAGLQVNRTSPETPPLLPPISLKHPEMVLQGLQLASELVRSCGVMFLCTEIPSAEGLLRIAHGPLGALSCSWNTKTMPQLCMGETEVPCFVQYIEEPVNSLEDGLTFYQETGVPIALDESLDHAMRQVSRQSCTLLRASPGTVSLRTAA